MHRHLRLLLIGLVMCSCAVSNEQKVERVLQRMTTEEKVMQITFACLDSYLPADKHAKFDGLVQAGLGGVIVMEDEIVKALDRINEIQRIAKIPLVISMDGEYGPAMRYAEFPFFPKMMQLGALPNDTLIYKMGVAVGELCKEVKIYINFAPDVDINVNPLNPVINARSFGSDREKVASYGSTYMRGMQDAGIFACAKHFPGHGDTEVDSHQSLPVLPFSKERLDSLELYPFKRLIDDGVELVMLGHLHVPAYDTMPSSISYPIVTELLKKRLGFKGLVITDALGMKGVVQDGNYVQVNVAAYKAGVDLLLMPHEIPQTVKAIVQYVSKSEQREKDLDERVRKILTLKAKIGMLDEDYDPYCQTDGILEKIHRPQDSLLNKQLSEQSMTLIQNKRNVQNGPFIDKTKKIAYVGYHAEYQPPKLKFCTTEEISGFADRSGVLQDNSVIACLHMQKAGYPMDYFALPEEVDLNALRDLTRQLQQYDYIIIGVHDCLAQRHNMLKIPSEEAWVLQQLARTKPTAVLYFGNPYSAFRLPFIKDTDAFFVCYSDTYYNEEAVADIMMGKIPAVGQLPVTLPEK